MKKENLNFIIDTVAFVAFVLLISTGVLMRYILPPGSGHFSMLWEMDRHEWGQLHFWIAVVFMVFMALHLFLHWKWIVRMVSGHPLNRSAIRVAIAVVGIITLVSLAAVPFFGRVEQTGEPPHKSQSLESVENHDYNIDGSMTLKELERLTGVSGIVIVRELGLPNNLSMNERLGKLRKEYEFELNDVRKVVQKQVGENKTTKIKGKQ